MTAPDVRTVAQTEALERWPRQDISVMHDADLSNYLCRRGFEAGAVWGAALVTPTRRRAILAVQQALGCDIDDLEGFMPGCQEHEVDITEEGLCPSATAAADAVLALMPGEGNRE